MTAPHAHTSGSQPATPRKPRLRMSLRFVAAVPPCFEGSKKWAKSPEDVAATVPAPPWSVNNGGAALLSMPAPSAVAANSGQALRPQEIPSSLDDLPDDWNGPSGIGDFAGSNGNTADVVNRAHREIRNGKLDERIKNATPVDDIYDLVVVGAGISGLSAAHLFLKERPGAKVLCLEQHAIFGGEARLNEVEVDGYTLQAPQGSTLCALTAQQMYLGDANENEALFNELGYGDLNIHYQKPQNTKLRIPDGPWEAMSHAQNAHDHAYYFENKGMVLNPWRNGLADTPWSDKFKKALMQVFTFRHSAAVENRNEYLDSITYRQFLLDVVKVPADVVDEVCDFMDQWFLAAGWYRSDTMSAYNAGGADDNPPIANWGPKPFLDWLDPYAKDGYYGATFPGGYGKVNWDALDRPGDNYRLRVNATVFSVLHNDKPDKSSYVIVTYVKDGKMYSVRGKTAVCAGQQHANYRICYDVSSEIRDAMSRFFHHPVLVINVAVRNWRFLEKLGAASVRWFNGSGWFTSLYRPRVGGGEKQALDPDKPFILTQWNPIYAGEPGGNPQQRALKSRMGLFATPFSEIERSVVEQFQKMFGPYGFDAKRDIAAIIANRQGHAYAIHTPGMAIGRDGKKAPLEILAEPFNRMAFAHAELSGIQLCTGAMRNGRRAARQMLAVTG